MGKKTNPILLAVGTALTLAVSAVACAYLVKYVLLPVLTAF